MNKFEKEIHNYISGTERMSGYDSYDSGEGDMAYFDDSEGFDGDTQDYSGDMGMSYANGGSQNVGISDPYVISYQNTTTTNVTAILFGYNDYFGATNYGNPAAVVITNLQGGTYGRLIAQSNNKFFKIGKWRFQSTVPSQLQQTLTINHVDANGKQYSTPLNLSSKKFSLTIPQTSSSSESLADGFLASTAAAATAIVVIGTGGAP
jgi:hypothetical protein